MCNKYTLFKISNHLCCKYTIRENECQKYSRYPTHLGIEFYELVSSWPFLLDHSVRQNSSKSLTMFIKWCYICNKDLSLRLPGNHSHSFKVLMLSNVLEVYFSNRLYIIALIQNVYQLNLILPNWSASTIFQLQAIYIIIVSAAVRLNPHRCK